VEEAQQLERLEVALRRRAATLADAETHLSHRERAARELVTRAETAVRVATDAELRTTKLRGVAREIEERGELLVAAEAALRERERLVSERELDVAAAVERLERRETELEEREQRAAQHADLLEHAEQEFALRRRKLYAV
jgi:hypothetical protein